MITLHVSRRRALAECIAILGLQHKDVARRLDLHPAYFSRVINGKVPQDGCLDPLARLLKQEAMARRNGEVLLILSQMEDV